MWSPIPPISNLVDLVDLEDGVDESYVDITIHYLTHIYIHLYIVWVHFAHQQLQTSEDE